MGSHPLNLGFRLVLELAALVGLGFGGYALAWAGWGAVVLTIVPPVAAAMVWGTFAVPEDPSRSGRAPVPVSGRVRLVIESVVFAAAAAAFLLADMPVAVAVLGVGVIAHYALSLDRIRWLLEQ